MLVSGILLGMLAAFAVFSYASLVQVRGSSFDFYVHYVGARVVWAGETPYTEAVATRIQLDMFGQRVTEGSNIHRVAYPAYAHVFLGPFALLPAPAAIALWMALQLLGLFTAPLIWFYLYGWRPRSLIVAALMLGFVFVFRYPIITYVIAQFNGVMLLAVTLGVWALVSHRDGLAGGLLALATVPPTITLPFAGLLLGILLLRGRWRALAVFIAMLAGATLISFGLIGWWLPDFLVTISAYAQYANTVWWATDIPALGLGLLPLYGGLLARAGWYWWRTSAVRQAQVDLAVTLLTVMVGVLPITGSYTLTLLIVPLAATAARLGSVQSDVGRWLLIVLFALTLVSPWLYFVVGGGLSGVEVILMPAQVALLWGAAQVAADDGVTPPTRYAV